MSEDKFNWLVMTDVDAIQSYLFSSIRLSTIAGASQIVVDNDKRIKEIAGNFGGIALFSAGGAAVVLLRCETSGTAQDFIEQAKKAFSQKSISGHLSTSDPIDLHKYEHNFAEAITAAAESLEKNKRLGYLLGEAAIPPLARRCDTCGNEAAIAPHRFGEETYWLGPTCDAKRNARERDWLTLLKQHDEWSKLRYKHLADDFSELAGDDYLAVVVADVNGVGIRLREIQSREDYVRFSKGLDDAVKVALQAALLKGSAPSRENVLAGTKKLPLQVLFQGGDDIILACQGQLALPLVQTLTKTFAEQAKGSWTGGSPMGMSAGLVLTHPKFPFLTAHHIAERLLSEAKQTARKEKWTSGAVDFAIISESHASPQAILDDRVIRYGDNDSLFLTGRPLHVADTGMRSLGVFKEACRLAKSFPRNKLFDLRQRCAAPYWEPAKTQVEFNTRVKELKQYIEDWLARVGRRSEMAKLWNDVLATLELKADGFYPSNGNTWRTPLGDLADAIGLWEPE